MNDVGERRFHLFTVHQVGDADSSESGGFDFIAANRYPEIERVEHLHHAGSSSGIVDGAALVLVGSQEAGQRHGLRPRARSSR